MTARVPNQLPHPYVSMAVIAWNEERAIVAMLDSLFDQSLFDELAKRDQQVEIICVANGCTDRTVEIANEIFQRVRKTHRNVLCRAVNLKERGKLNAWNQYVHSISSSSAQFLFLMDADILLHKRETLSSMLGTLEEDSKASVAVDLPRKDIYFKGQKRLRERLSLGASEITTSSTAQLCAQLYCIRAGAARNIFLPKDLAACEDGFIKHLVCTDFLRQEPKPERIRVAAGAEHTFEAYTSAFAIFKNQKRQIIGQTIVHILVDDYLKRLPLADGPELAKRLRALDEKDPLWLKRLIAEHLQKVRWFWRLYPGLATHRLKSLRRLGPLKQSKCFPTAAIGSLIAFVASWFAYRALKAGATDYWPRAERTGLSHAQPMGQGA